MTLFPVTVAVYYLALHRDWRATSDLCLAIQVVRVEHPYMYEMCVLGLLARGHATT